MKTNRNCNFHAGAHTGQCRLMRLLEKMLYECFMGEVDIIAGDANSCAYRVTNSKGQSTYNSFFLRNATLDQVVL